MKLSTSTNILPAIRVGMYETELDERYKFDMYYEELDGMVENKLLTQDQADEISWSFNTKAYTEDVGKTAFDILKASFTEDFKKRFKIKKLINDSVRSPAYYNFSTDELDFTIEMADNSPELLATALEKYKDNEDFIKWLRDNFTSYDGFWSYTANNPEEFIQQARAGREQELSFGIYWILKEEYDLSREANNEELYESLEGSLYDYVTLPDDFFEKLNKYLEVN